MDSPQAKILILLHPQNFFCEMFGWLFCKMIKEKTTKPALIAIVHAVKERIIQNTECLLVLSKEKAI